MDQSLLEAAHKNVILWKLMSKHNFKALIIRHNAQKSFIHFSLMKDVGYYDRYGQLMSLDEELVSHIYRSTINMFSFDKLSFFPTTSSKNLVYARAAFLDALIEDFKYGFKWKSFIYFHKTTNAIANACIDIDLNFNDNDIEMEKSIINCIELNEYLKKAPILPLPA